jgi:hypothetical protein
MSVFSSLIKVPGVEFPDLLRKIGKFVFGKRIEMFELVEKEREAFVAARFHRFGGEIDYRCGDNRKKEDAYDGKDNRYDAGRDGSDGDIAESDGCHDLEAKPQGVVYACDIGVEKPYKQRAYDKCDEKHQTGMSKSRILDNGAHDSPVKDTIIGHARSPSF